MEQKTLREQFARLMSDEAALLTTLEQQLHQEHVLLSSNNVEGLEQASGARQQTVAALLRVEDERRQLCRLMGRDADKAGLAATLSWCDPTGTLAKPQGDCARLAERCRTQNERNGMLVTARLKRVSGMLGMLDNNTKPGTYSARNARGYSATAGRFVSISA